jgi:ABC-type polysaccharide/polyol phosphate export permease
VAVAAATAERELTAAPASWRDWAADVAHHGPVLAVLARKDFQTRYKRASLGVLWAVAVPVLQGVVLAVVFSRVTSVGGDGFAAYVLSGIVAWSYFAGTLAQATTSIVDAAGLTEKVWFPRVLLVLAPALANLVGFAVSLAVAFVAAPFLGGELSARTLLLVPATLLLAGFTVGLSLATSALYVYFRDVKFMVQAALLVWLYVTPVVYPKSLLRGLAGWSDLNPMTGVVELFHEALVGGAPSLARPVLVSVVATSVLLAAGLGAHRRHDRLFVDKL